ncbi:MAG: hypothetical protein RLZZ142_340 [Verrucomicrobiota bacterium]|jgi:uncharacterized protein YqgC (DUF456 family)
MEMFWWMLVIGLMALGLLGTLLPLLPGAALILGAAFVYHWFLASASHPLGWEVLWGLMGLTVLSYAVDLLAAAWGARRFGASGWGIAGGFLGLVVGFAFALPGLILGPPLGVMLGELGAGKPLGEAFRVAWGTVVGTAVGMLVRFAIALAMVVWLGVALWRHAHGTP